MNDYTPKWGIGNIESDPLTTKTQKGEFVLRLLIALTLTVLAGSCLAACAPAPLPETYTLGALLLEEDFSQGYGWKTYDAAGVYLNVEDGVYRGEAAGGAYVWGINAEAHTDAVLEVDAELLSAGSGNGYGLVCRANTGNNGDGYYFLIGGDGTYTIRRGRGDAVEDLVAWERHSAIRQGQAQNRLRAVCVGDYLAFYVNGEFVAQTRDDRYQRGFAGAAFVAPRGESIQVEFDNLRVWAAAWGSGQ